MKKIFQKLTLFCLSVCSLFLTFSCGSNGTSSSVSQSSENPTWEGQHEEYTYITKYSEEEHLIRIRRELDELWTQSTFLQEYLLDIDIEILYSFPRNQPEYFLLDFTFSLDDPRLKYQHIVGHIRYDYYYVFVIGYKFDCQLGRNPIYNVEYLGKKKYFGAGIIAVQLDDETMLQVYDAKYMSSIYQSKNDYEKACEQKILLEEDYRHWTGVDEIPMLRPVTHLLVASQYTK